MVWLASGTKIETIARARQLIAAGHLCRNACTSSSLPIVRDAANDRLTHLVPVSAAGA